MYALSGFVASNAFISNTPGVVSPIGELSKEAASFTRELGIYGLDAFPSVRLMSFSSELDDVAVAVSPARSTLLLELGQWLVQRSIAGSLSDDEENCRLQIVNEFSSRIDLIDVGPMVQSGIYWMPSSLTMELIEAEDNRVRLWFSDPAFQAQYDGYTSLVVDPIIPIDDFHKSPAIVKPLIAAIRVPDITNRAKEVAGDKPYTMLYSRDFNWVDKNDPANTAPVPWSVVIYGAAGINDDLIKQALQDHILANSAYSREEWEVIFPDIFLPTEFYLVPTWFRYAIPEGMALSGTHSPIVRYAELIQYGLNSMFGYDQAHLEEFLCSTTSSFRSVAFLACGHPRNRNGIKDFLAMWPEYCNISPTHLDFNRLSPSTQNFISLVISMFAYAEKMDEFSDIPQGMTKVQRGEVWYLSSTYESVQYLVPWKSNGLTPTP